MGEGQIWMNDTAVLPQAETRLPENFRWPGDKRIAVMFLVAYEGWSEGKAPGIGPMGNPLQPSFLDLNALSWANYGHRCGVQRILKVLDRQRIKSSAMVCGVLAERYPDTVRAIAEAGHEIVAHSYGMDVIPVYLDEAQERDNIRRTTDLIEKACGVRPKGWISPRGTPSARTLRMLVEEGYEWHGDHFDDDLPYVIRFGGRSIIAFPLGMGVNDLPISVRYGNTARAMLEAFEVEFDYLQRRENGPAKIDATVHAHVFGRPAGIWVYEEIMERAKAAKDVWIGTRAEAVAHLRTVLP